MTLQKLELAQKHLQSQLTEKESIAKALEQKITQTKTEQTRIEQQLRQYATLEKHAQACQQQFEKRKLFYQSLIQK
jgi:septal ring factor EnvC (AmiA/AmiB activator)